MGQGARVDNYLGRVSPDRLYDSAVYRCGTARYGYRIWLSHDARAAPNPAAPALRGSDAGLRAVMRIVTAVALLILCQASIPVEAAPAEEQMLVTVGRLTVEVDRLKAELAEAQLKIAETIGLAACGNAAPAK